MKINRNQQKELKKIDHCLQQVEELSEQFNLDLEDITFMTSFPDISLQLKKEVFSRNKSRQEVFEISRREAERKSAKMIR
ncbi:MAG: hypothetical protein JNL88_00185 [Bacteroidia bacterium]|nr:hypothetical protein [Bacteroidia bacterium]